MPAAPEATSKSLLKTEVDEKQPKEKDSPAPRSKRKHVASASERLVAPVLLLITILLGVLIWAFS